MNLIKLQRIIIFLLSFTLPILHSSNAGEIYKCIDAEGGTNFTERPCANREETDSNKASENDLANEDKWIADLRKAAEQGDMLSQRVLGTMYYNGEYVIKNHREGIKWLSKAVESGSVKAQQYLVDMHKGVKLGATGNSPTPRTTPRTTSRITSPANRESYNPYTNMPYSEAEKSEAKREAAKLRQQGINITNGEMLGIIRTERELMYQQ